MLLVTREKLGELVERGDLHGACTGDDALPVLVRAVGIDVERPQSVDALDRCWMQ
jgi:hypothetical protein